jgi:hypothetical protein
METLISWNMEENKMKCTGCGEENDDLNKKGLCLRCNAESLGLNTPLEPLQSIFDILYSPYLEDEEKIERAISKTQEISAQIKENLGRFLRKAHINCSHDMETTKGFVSLLKTFNMYSE